MFVPGFIWVSSLGIDLCRSAEAHYILRIHVFVHPKAGAYYNPLGMLQENEIDCGL